MKVLLVKMSSLGDVVHALAGVTEAAGHGVRFDWVVEEGFAAIPALNAAVERVVPIAWRRWRGALWRHRRDLGAFIDHLRGQRYDLVLDSQGLVKSAVVTRLARSARRFGYDARSAREALATVFYDGRARVAAAQHAVDRQRQLFGAALGYPVRGPDAFGLEDSSVRPRGTIAVLLHGTTWPSKEWPEPMWSALARRLLDEGFAPLLPWGDARERARAERIARASGAQVAPQCSVRELAGILARAALVVGVDSGLTHLAGALGTPTVAVYGATASELTGCRGARVHNLDARFACAPCLARTCAYQGAAPVFEDGDVFPACYASVDPARVWAAAKELMRAHRVQHL